MPAPAATRILAAEGAPRGGLAALCITQTIGWGVLYYALIAAVRPISEDTGWDPGQVTGAFSAGLLVSAAAGIAVGRILDWTGPRTLMIGGTLLGMLALAGVALAPNLPVFFILAGSMGLIAVPLHARYLNRNWAPAAPGTLETDHRALAGKVRRSPEFLGLQALMVLLCLGLYTVTLNIIPLLVEKGADYATAALGLGLVGAGQVGGRLLFAAIPAGARLQVITGTAACAVFLLAALPGPVPALIAAGMLAGAVRGCQTLLQATIVADRWGTQKLGTLQGLFTAPLTAVTAVAPAAGPLLAAWLGTYTLMAYAMSAAAATAAILAAAGGVRKFRTSTSS